MLPLDVDGTLWLLTPKSGIDGHVDPSDIAEAATTAGLHHTKPINVTPAWTGTRVAVPSRRR
ncbi:DUF3052 family protein [Streptomyces sp. NPDC050844]|uniref:DUF3052 family protein n=1 Tax=Streptomyces sp. NPDC050844 TaxID=3155790 RepID=UPI003400E999